MKPSTVPVTATLAEAFSVVSAGGYGVAAVADDAGVVVGTVTDGAIRRSWLTEGRLDLGVAEVVGRRAQVVEAGASDTEVAARLRSARLRAMPEVEAGRAVGLRTAAEVGAEPPAPVAVLMVGGRGERLRPLTDRVPKPLLRIGGHSIVERIILKLGAAGVAKVWLAVKYLAEEFEAQVGDGGHLGVEVGYLHEEQPLHTAGALTLLPEPPEVPVFVSNGDLVTTVDYAAMFDFHRQHAGAVTVAAVEHLTHVPYGVLRTAEHHLLGIDEKPSRRDLVNAGMYVLEPDVLPLLPVGQRRGMPELIDDVVAEGRPVHAFPVLERWIDIGSPEEFELVLHAFATGELE